MARLFDNNAANYMSRSSVNLGLNGATECSIAFWINVTAVDTTLEQRIAFKQIADGWNTISTRIGVNTTQLIFGVESQSLGQYPTWQLSAGIGTGVWTRMLWTWKRNAITSADAVAYVNGQPVATTFVANGYAAGFVMEEASNNLMYGIRPVTLTSPLNAALDWVCIWNRQLTAQEALLDYTNPRNVTNGLLSIVECDPNRDQGVLGGSMTINGTLNIVGGPPITSAVGPMRTKLRARPFAPGIAR